LISPAAEFYIFLVVLKIFQETSAQFLNKMHSNATHTAQIARQKSRAIENALQLRAVFIYTPLVENLHVKVKQMSNCRRI
jgi:hypothetical protein